VLTVVRSDEEAFIKQFLAEAQTDSESPQKK